MTSCFKLDFDRSLIESCAPAPAPVLQRAAWVCKLTATQMPPVHSRMKRIKGKGEKDLDGARDGCYPVRVGEGVSESSCFYPSAQTLTSFTAPLSLTSERKDKMNKQMMSKA